MPEEKPIHVINDERIPTSGLGLLGYMGSRFARDASQLASNVKNIFHPIFTQDTDDEAELLLEDDALSKESEPSLLANPSNDIFSAEDEETLKRSKLNIEKFNQELQRLERVDASIAQKAHDTKLPNHCSATIGIQLIRQQLDPIPKLMSDKIRSLVKEGNDPAKTKARRLAEITKAISMLPASKLEHKYSHEDALLQAIASIRKAIVANQRELSSYRSKWGSGFFFGKILRMDLTKRVACKALIDNLSDQLDEIENRLGEGFIPRR